MKRNHILFLLSVFGIFFGACKHESTVPLANLAADSTRYRGLSCSADTVYFYNDIGPLIITSCAMSGCHDGNSFGPDALTTYSKIRSIVSPGNVAGSKMYRVLTGSDGRMPPSPRAAFTTAQLALVSTWIQQGAKNNGCIDKACDTTTVTYSTTIVPILQSNCTGCHSGNNPSGGIKLDNYASVSTVVANKKLIGSITQSTGYWAMPPNGKLSDCNIGKIKAWVYRGALNN
jgi:cytochrome c5